LRDQIREAGFEVVDTAAGFELTAREVEEPPAREVYGRSEDVPSRLEDPTTTDFSIQWIVEGWPEDVRRGIDSIRRHCRDRSVQQVVVDLTESSWPEEVEVISMDAGVGWAAGRN